jgi:small-conductance mechanosensitive channel
MLAESLEILLDKLPFQFLDYLVITLNLLIFIFASAIIKKSYKATDDITNKKRVLALRSINLVLFVIYVVTGLFEIIFNQEPKSSNLQNISKTGLCILLAYILLHYIQGLILYRFGRERDIDGEKLHSESYSSEIIGLIAVLIVSSISILVIIQIWELNSWLQATSVLGGILLLLFAVKDYFLSDMIHGLIIHYNRSFETGSVIRIKEFDLMGVVMKITLSQTVIRDLLQKHEICLPNTKLRNATVETLSSSSGKGFRDYIDFNIGYEQSLEDVESFTEKVWQQALEDAPGLNKEVQPQIIVINNSDHAVTWRFSYYVKNPYRILTVKNTINTIAFKLSQQENLGLNTPLTHKVLSN